MNINSMCRVCETIHGLKNIFDEENEELLLMLRRVAEISVDFNDLLPKHICAICCRKLRQAADFIEQCKATDYKLREESTKENAEETTHDETNITYYAITDMCENASTSAGNSPRNDETEAIYIKEEEVANEEDFYQVESLDNSESTEHMLDDAADEILVETRIYDGNALKDDSCSDVEEAVAYNSNEENEAFDDFIVEDLEPDETMTGEDEEINDVISVSPIFFEKKTYSCNSCPEVFTTCQELNAHKKSHGAKRFQCSMCEKCFSRHYRLRDHLLTHGDQIKLPCELCDKTYTNQSNLDRHIKHFHRKEKLHACHVCEMSFARKSTLITHLAVHSDTRNFECDKCGKKFKNNYYLRVHHKSHIPVELRPRKRPPQKRKVQLCICSHCGKESNSVSLHLNHMRIHTGEKPFECTECFKRFTFKQSLKTHMLMHSGEKPHVCDICSMAFRQIGHLKGHKQAVHSGLKQFKCQYCSKSFALRGNLTIHERLHTGEKPYGCNLCSKRFNDSNGLKRHNLAHMRYAQVQAGAATTQQEPPLQQVVLQPQQDVTISQEQDHESVCLIKDGNDLNQLNVSLDVYLDELGTEYTEIIESETTLEPS